MIVYRLAFQLGFAGLIVAAALAGAMGLYPGDIGARVVGVLTGLALVLYANVMPKLHETSCLKAERSPRWRGVRLFAGRVMMFGGLGYIAAHMFAPIDLAPRLGMVIVATALIAMGVRFVMGPRDGNGSTAS